MNISAVVLTKNEENNIGRCLKSLDFCNEIIMVDDYSEDDTVQKVKKFKSLKVFVKKLNNDFASQRNFGLSKATNEWVLFVDADEEITNELKSEIRNLKFEKDAYYIRRRDYFWGKELKYGEVRQISQIGLIRLIKKNSGKWMGNVHEEFKIQNSKLETGRSKNYINHFPHPSLKEFISEVNNYSSIRSEELFNRGTKTNIFEMILFPFGKFFYNYFLNLGFLDGPAGFTYAFMMSFHSFLVRAKLYQLINKN